MLKLPYGESNFVKVITEGFFYQDRTAFIRDLETAPALVYYLRPRRFGKSLCGTRSWDRITFKTDEFG